MKKKCRVNDKNRIFAAVNWNKLNSVIIKTIKQMKKVYMLLLAVIVAVSASAQVAMPGSQTFSKKQPVKANLPKEIKGGPGENLISYPAVDALFWDGQDTNLLINYVWHLQNDTMGLLEYNYSSGAVYDHPWVYAMSQTYDLNSYFYDDAYGQGSISLAGSIYLLYKYQRFNLDPTIKDTMIVGIVTADPQSYYYYSGGGEGNSYYTCFYHFLYDVNTAAPANSHIYKFPLGEEQATTADINYRYLEEAIGLNNINEKVWLVSISFKRGYNVGMNDTLSSSFTLWTTQSYDNDYYVGDGDEFVADPYRCDNMSHGGWVWTNLVNNQGANSYYYPSFMFDEMAHFIAELYLKVSCTDCEIVNVPELDKNNPTVYPNPATNNFTVDLGNDEKATIQLFNIVGQQVYSETITGSAQVNVANLHSGVYMLKVNQNGKVYTTKVVVK